MSEAKTEDSGVGVYDPTPLRAVVYTDIWLDEDEGLHFFPATFMEAEGLYDGECECANMWVQLLSGEVFVICRKFEDVSVISRWKALAACAFEACRILLQRAGDKSILLSAVFGRNLFGDALSFYENSRRFSKVNREDMEVLARAKKIIIIREIIEQVHPVAILSEDHRRCTSFEFMAASVGLSCDVAEVGWVSAPLVPDAQKIDFQSGKAVSFSVYEYPAGCAFLPHEAGSVEEVMHRLMLLDHPNPT